MGNLLDFEQAFQKRLASKLATQMRATVGNLTTQLEAMDNLAEEIAQDYFTLITRDPVQAIHRLPEFIERTRDINPSRAYESMAGGPNQDWIGPLLDILGIVYPELEKSVREYGLRQCLNYFDGLRSDYAQNHVALINEPWLACDIVITRPIYWCGYKEYCDYSQENKSWKNFSAKMNEAKSTFWLAMAVTCPQYTSLEVRINFYRTFPKLMDRTKDAIAAMSAVYGGRKAEREHLNLSTCIDERIAKHDPLLHDTIKAKIEEKKWILLE